MNNTLSYIHFWVTLAGAYLIFWPMHYQGMAGMPRRYLDKSMWVSFSQFHALDAMISVVTIIVFLAQILFVFNFFYSMYKGRRCRSINPWSATTLEWTTPINPGHGNWVGEIPEVKDGLMTIAKTEEILYCKQKAREKMNRYIKRIYFS